MAKKYRRAGAAQGPEVGSFAKDDQSDALKQNAKSMEELRDSVLNLSKIIEQQAFLQQEHLQHIREQGEEAKRGAASRLHQTRDFSNTYGALGDIGDRLKEVLNSTDGLASKLAGIVAGGGDLVGAGASGLAGQVNAMNSRLFGNVHSYAANSMASMGGLGGVEGQMFGGVVQGLSSGVAGLASEGLGTLSASIAEAIPLVGGLVGGLASLTVAVAGAAAAFGIFSSVQSINDTIDFNKNILRTAPNSLGSLSSTIGIPQNFFSEVGAAQEIGNKSNDEIKQILNAVLSTRPSDMSADQLKQQARYFGVLQDYGVNLGTTAGASKYMQKELGQSADESSYNLLRLADTAKQHGIDIDQYITKVMEMTKAMRSFGYTVTGVNKVFDEFKSGSFSDGVKLTGETAYGATQTLLDLQRGVPLATAGYLGLQNPDLVINSPGHGFNNMGAGGLSFGDLSRYGALGSYVGAKELQAHGAAGMLAAAGRQVHGIIDPMVERTGATGQAREVIESRLFADTFGQMMGFDSSKYGKDPGVTAAFDAIKDGKVTKEVEEQLKSMEKTTLDNLPSKFLNLFDAEYKKLSILTHPLDAIKELVNEIRNLLVATFTPAVEAMSLGVVWITKFLQSFAATRDLGSAAEMANDTTGELRKAYKGYNESLLNNMGADQRTKDIYSLFGLYGSDEDTATSQQKFAAWAGKSAWSLATLGSPLAGIAGDWVGNWLSPHSNNDWEASTGHIGRGKEIAGGSKKYRMMYQAYADQMADTYGIPRTLLRNQITQESGWNPNARSGAGAGGIAQIMPQTAKGWGVKNVYDPYESMRAMAKNMAGYWRTYMKQGLSYEEAYKRALGAYNAGPGAISKYHGLPPYKETQNYAKRIMAGANKQEMEAAVKINIGVTTPRGTKRNVRTKAVGKVVAAGSG